MFSKLFGKKKPEPTLTPASAAPAAPARAIPVYSAILERPSRTLPAGLVERESSPQFTQHRDGWQQKLLSQPRPNDTQHVVTTLAVPGGGVATFDLPDGSARAGLYFSSPVRAADYKDSMGREGAPGQLLALTLPGFLQMMRDLEAQGVTAISFDRCPRCTEVTILQTAEITTIEQAWNVRCVYKAREISREQLYFAYALDAARDGHLDEAREVALEAAAHVTLEDPNLHLLLGQLGLALADTTLTAEALALLKLMKADAHAGKLATVAEIGAADFEGPDGE